MQLEFDEDTEVKAPTGASVSLTIAWCTIGPYGTGFYVLGRVPWGPFTTEDEAKLFMRQSLASTHLDTRQ